MAGQAAQLTPQEIWSIYCGDINSSNTAKLIDGLTAVSAGGAKRIHLLFQSWGGFVGDGVFLYNVLRTLSLEIIFYNAGQVSSAAVLAFLGAKRRKTTANAVFMIHKGSNAGSAGAGVDRLKAAAANLTIDDERIEAILRSHLRLPESCGFNSSFMTFISLGRMPLALDLLTKLGILSRPLVQES